MRSTARCCAVAWSAPARIFSVRKDFPQRLGVAIVVVGIVGSSIAWGYSLLFATFAILFATALVDVVLYLIVPDALMCYRCGAQYRLAEGMSRHGDLIWRLTNVTGNRRLVWPATLAKRLFQNHRGLSRFFGALGEKWDCPLS